MAITQRAFEEGWVPEDRWGYRCYQVRKERGLKVEEIAALCDIKPSTWSSWENGGTPQNQAVIAFRIAERMNCDRDWLAFGSRTGSYRDWTFSDGEQLPLVWSETPRALAHAA